MSIPQVQSMSDDYQHSIDKARQDCIRQRLELGLNPDPDCPPNALAPKPKEVLPFLRRGDDDAFTAPQRVDLMQLRESNTAATLAASIAKTVYNRDLLDLDRQTKAHCIRLATFCIRESNQNFRDSGMHGSINEIDRWLMEDGGRTFRQLTDVQREAIATFLAPRVLMAYLGIMEGTIVLPMGRYLAIVEGRGL